MKAQEQADKERPEDKVARKAKPAPVRALERAIPAPSQTR